MIIIQEESRKVKNLKKFLLIITILVLMTGSFFVGAGMEQRNESIKRLANKELVYFGKIIGKYNDVDNSKLVQDVDFGLFWQVWDIVKNEYVGRDELTDKKLFYGALKGLVSAAEDPYTVFMDPKISQEFSDDMAGTFEGIGAELSIKKEVLTVIAPIANSPAQRAGILAGDKILAINGESTVNMSVEDAVNKIRGPKGTEVKLTILHNGQDKTAEISITRDTIVVKSVTTEFRKDKIFVVKISNFNDDTSELFKQAVNEIIKVNPKGIIIDLRNNTGGYLDTAVEIASDWVKDGVVVTEKYSEEKQNKHNANGMAKLGNYKTIILVNQGSASASEILAGALHDYKKATLVGEKTFGKGSVQTLENLSDGSSVKITVAEWLTPNGANINKEGIKPDVEIPLTVEDYNNNKDPQMDKAVELMLTK